MVDISKCSGIDCPIKDSCYRYKAPSFAYQSLIMPSPLIENGVFSCDLFWGESQTGILNQLEQIVGIKKQQK